MVNKTANHSLIIIMQALQVSLSVNLKVVAPSYFFVRKLKMKMCYAFDFCGFLSSFMNTELGAIHILRHHVGGGQCANVLKL